MKNTQTFSTENDDVLKPNVFDAEANLDLIQKLSTLEEITPNLYR